MQWVDPDWYSFAELWFLQLKMLNILSVIAFFYWLTLWISSLIPIGYILFLCFNVSFGNEIPLNFGEILKEYKFFWTLFVLFTHLERTFESNCFCPMEDCFFWEAFYCIVLKSSATFVNWVGFWHGFFYWIDQFNCQFWFFPPSTGLVQWKDKELGWL